ncbi:hypothetical protein JAAARDRAFT_174038 [Jaapia argillacea MUCL 33604]|uniref:SHSP domain-containing protein n=1 Tax=Jaapia argillacea MUCL 33604 TaxID=933084 RepID=A0A067QBQ0_9AGAM|nr:hypothetical protein JAAARDRAFT_174038 [Jaapia argillacea MUCL 33604]
MSMSPPIRRLSTSSSKREEDLINAYEAEEERIINVLSRKLEQLREEKIELENIREAESESRVNRLSRELSALRLAQQQQQQSHTNGAESPDARPNGNGYAHGSMSANPLTPSPEVMLEAMRRENEHLRSRLVDTEREYIRLARLNEIYREELIDHRHRLGISVDNLIGLSSSTDPYSQPTHRRSSSSSSSPSTSVLTLPSVHHSRPTSSVPIPRPASQIHRPINSLSSESTTPLSHSPSSADSPFPFSPVTSTNPASLVSNHTSVTTPPSSASLNSNPTLQYNNAMLRTLPYPTVPPPSLSSSWGSPVIPYHIPPRDPSLSPIESRSRRNSYHRRGSFERRVPDPGSGRGTSHSNSRRASVERGARVAETGTLVSRSRRNSLASTSESHLHLDDKISPMLSLSTMSYHDYPYNVEHGQYSTTPTTPSPYPSTSPWEPEQDLPPMNVQPQQQFQAPPPPPPSQPQTIQLQERVPIVPSQRRVQVHHVEEFQPRHTSLSQAVYGAGGGSESGRSDRDTGDFRPRLSVDPVRPRASSALAVRSTSSRAHHTASHPYRRPSTQGEMGGTASGSRRTSTPGPGLAASERYAVPVSCVDFPFAHHGIALVSPCSSAMPPPPQSEGLAMGRRYNIRTDVYFSVSSNVMTAMFELPGVKKSDLRITLSMCPYSRVRQLTVSGKALPLSLARLFTVRERKYGEFSRTLVVPPDTKAEDVTADMEDGILILKVPGGTRTDPIDPQEIVIR